MTTHSEWLKEHAPRCSQCGEPLDEWCIADHKRKDGYWTGPQLTYIPELIAVHEHNYMLHVNLKCVNDFNTANPLLVPAL